MFHLLRFPVRCKQIQNADPQCCCYLVCLSCIYSCDDHAGAISARVSMLQNCPWSQIHVWKSKNVWKCICHGGLSRECMRADGSDWSSHRAERTGLKRITPRARPRCRLVPCVWKCATSGRSIGATLCDHPRVSCCRTITARDIAAVVRVSLVCRSSTVLVPQGKSELNCAPRKGTLTSKPQTWIASVVKRRYA